MRAHKDGIANENIFEQFEKFLLVGDSTANSLSLNTNALRL